MLSLIYRMHDDLWLWDANIKKCAAEWKEINKYAGMVGLKFNKSKTGLASTGSATSDKPSGLPNGDICWGFLKCEPSQSRFIIDQDDALEHSVSGVKRIIIQ